MNWLTKIPFTRDKAYFLGLIILAIGLSWSNFLMSIAQIILVANWIVKGDLKSKGAAFFHDRTALIMVSIFLVHILWLANTSNFTYAFNDIRIKLPLLLLPLLFASSERLEKLQISFLENCFIAGVFCGSIIILVLLSGFTPVKINDIREYGGFISHIRFALCVCFAILLLLARFFSVRSVAKRSYLGLLLVIYFLLFLAFIQSGTGFSILIIYTSIYLIYKSFVEKSKWRMAAYIGAFLAFSIFLWSNAKSALKEFYYTVPVDFNALEKSTVNGNAYNHYTSDNKRENGIYAGIYISWKELEKEWNKKSKFDFNGLDKKEQELKFTLCRYLASKNLRKDSLGLSKLNPEDIAAIEAGITNYKYLTNKGVQARMQQIIWEYDSYKNGENPGGQSLLMRIAYWKIGKEIAAENLLTGVGTGDVQQSFEQKFQESKSNIPKKYWRHSHNQFLTFLIAFGIIGLLVFIASVVLPILWHNKQLQYAYVSFLLIILLSMFTEDTLETQAGVTLYVFFNCLYLFASSSSTDVEQ